MHRTATEIRHDLYRLDGRRFDLSADEYQQRRASLLRQLARAESRHTGAQHHSERLRSLAQRLTGALLLALVLAAAALAPQPVGPRSSTEATEPRPAPNPWPWPWPWPNPPPQPRPEPPQPEPKPAPKPTMEVR